MKNLFVLMALAGVAAFQAGCGGDTGPAPTAKPAILPTPGGAMSGMPGAMPGMQGAPANVGDAKKNTDEKANDDAVVTDDAKPDDAAGVADDKPDEDAPKE